MAWQPWLIEEQRTMALVTFSVCAPTVLQQTLKYVCGRAVKRRSKYHTHILVQCGFGSHTRLLFYGFLFIDAKAA